MHSMFLLIMIQPSSIILMPTKKYLHSKKNLVDIDAAVTLMVEFPDTTFAILKHNNACGVSSRENILDAWKDALAADPVSAFGGILISNREITAPLANEMNRLFFEVLL